MPTIVRYADPTLKIRPTTNGRRDVARYAKPGNMPSQSRGDKPSSQQSELVKQIIDAISMMPLFVWIQEQFAAAQQAGALTLSPADDVIPSSPVKPQEPPRQKYQRAAQPVRYDRPATDVQHYAKVTNAGRLQGTGVTVDRYTNGQQSRVMYAKHQESIKADCEAARRLALREGLTFNEAMEKLGVVSVPLPS